LYKYFLLLLIVCAGLSRAAVPGNDVYRRAVENPARSAADRERDARELPEQFLSFAGYKPGMHIADIFAGGGYYSELISRVVGPTGRVFLVNNPFYDTATQNLLASHLRDNRLANVVHSTVSPSDLKLKAGSLDSVLLVMSYHDLYFADPAQGWPAIDAGRFIDQIYTALKPGGSLLIIDHAAKPGSGSTVVQSLHRIDEAFAKRQFTAHGLLFEADWEGLRNPADDHSKRVFDPSIRGHTDRFVHRYRKPSE
jgi:predicted methyltransferase